MKILYFFTELFHNDTFLFYSWLRSYSLVWNETKRILSKETVVSLEIIVLYFENYFVNESERFYSPK